MADLRRRLNPGSHALSQLIRSGSLDFTGKSRPALYLEAELQDRSGGPAAELFGTSADLEGWSPGAESEAQRRRDEWRTLGFTLGPSLMSLFRHRIPDGTVSSGELAAHAGRTVQVAGLVATARNTQMHDGRAMQFVTLEDEEGLIEVSLFPGSCPRLPYLTLGPYLASGTVDDHLGVHALTARQFQLL
jgi:DNA polymerase III alpha subunit